MENNKSQFKRTVKDPEVTRGRWQEIYATAREMTMRIL